MRPMLKEFFGFGGYQREAEGFMSWQHLTFVTSLMIIMVVLAVVLGIKTRHKDIAAKNKVLIITALLMDGIELVKIVMMCFAMNDPMHWRYNLPLFLCSIPLMAIPLAALSKGRLKEASLDFVFIFGVLCAVLGTYGASQNYAAYPVLSLDNVASGLTHTISGFAALFIVISGMQSMKRKNIPITFAIIGTFGAMAYIANLLIPYNYMFLMRHDGTPYKILYDLVGGHPVIYPLSVMLLFVIYIAAFYGVYFLITRKSHNKSTEVPVEDKIPETV